MSGTSMAGRIIAGGSTFGYAYSIVAFTTQESFDWFNLQVTITYFQGPSLFYHFFPHHTSAYSLSPYMNAIACRRCFGQRLKR